MDYITSLLLLLLLLTSNQFIYKYDPKNKPDMWENRNSSNNLIIVKCHTLMPKALWVLSLV